jgi:hypothetical protein
MRYVLRRFAVALKHHLRGEVGIYYEDLYDLVRPLHDVRPSFFLLDPTLSSPTPTFIVFAQ